jgi:oxygen-independent coproporphyrinogen-3 oxidase
VALGAFRSTFGLADGAEVTTEANPESTSPAFFAGLVEAGFTRVSSHAVGAPHVLRVLERRHTPGGPWRRRGRRGRPGSRTSTST